MLDDGQTANYQELKTKLVSLAPNRFKLSHSLKSQWFLMYPLVRRRDESLE